MSGQPCPGDRHAFRRVGNRWVCRRCPTSRRTNQVGAPTTLTIVQSRSAS